MLRRREGPLGHLRLGLRHRGYLASVLGRWRCVEGERDESCGRLERVHSAGEGACHAKCDSSHPTRAALEARSDVKIRPSCCISLRFDAEMMRVSRVSICVTYRRQEFGLCWLECEGESFVSRMGVA